MPIIDMGRTRIRVKFLPHEKGGGTTICRMLKSNNLINLIQAPTNGWYALPCSIDIAKMLRDTFKKNDNWTWQTTDKYKAKIDKIISDEGEFKQVSGRVQEIKAMDPDLIVFDDYVFKTKPYRHQKIAHLLFREIRNLFLSWDMRTGKTFAVANAMQDALNRKQISTAIVLCPSGIMQSCWIRDVLNHTDLKGLAVKRPTTTGRLSLLKKSCITVPVEDGYFNEVYGRPSYYVFNHDAVRNEKVLNFILSELKPDCLVVDESHHAKTPSTKRTQSIVKISKFVHGMNGMVVCMTGTPITKDIRDLYSQMSIVDPKVFNMSFHAFKSKYCEIRNISTSDDPKDQGYEKLIAMKNFPDLKSRYDQRSFRVEIEECHDMPEKIYTTENIELTSEQRKYHDELLHNLITEIQGRVIDTTTLSKFSKLVQITGGYVYDKDSNVIPIKSNPKLDALEDLLDQILAKDRRKVVVWTNYRPSTLIIRQMLQRKGIGFSELTTQSDSDRNEAEYSFLHKSECRVMLGAPALAEGKDMSVASYAIYFDNSFKMVDRKQSEARTYTPESLVHRKIVYIDLIANNSIDEMIHEAIQHKADINSIVTKERLTSFFQRIKNVQS